MDTACVSLRMLFGRISQNFLCEGEHRTSTCPLYPAVTCSVSPSLELKKLDFLVFDFRNVFTQGLCLVVDTCSCVRLRGLAVFHTYFLREGDSWREMTSRFFFIQRLSLWRHAHASVYGALLNIYTFIREHGLSHAGMVLVKLHGVFPHAFLCSWLRVSSPRPSLASQISPLSFFTGQACQQLRAVMTTGWDDTPPLHPSPPPLPTSLPPSLPLLSSSCGLSLCLVLLIERSLFGFHSSVMEAVGRRCKTARERRDQCLRAEARGLRRAQAMGAAVFQTHFWYLVRGSMFSSSNLLSLSRTCFWCCGFSASGP